MFFFWATQQFLLPSPLPWKVKGIGSLDTLSMIVGCNILFSEGRLDHVGTTVVSRALQPLVKFPY